MLELRPSSYDHPDARDLTERAQAYYVEIYGGRDEDPLTADELEPPNGGFVIGYLDGVPVAMGGWLFTESPFTQGSFAQSPFTDPAVADERSGQRVAQIRRMFVDPGVRGRGVGAAVLAQLEDDAAAHGAHTIILATGRPQVEAIGLYRQHGYTDIPPFGYYAGGDLVVCLAKSLPAAAGQPTS